MRAGRQALVVALAAGLVGCGAQVKLTTHAPATALQITGAFVYPFGYRWDEPAWRSFELSQRLVEVALARGGDTLSFWGPSEFRVMKPAEDGAWVASTALPLLTATTARPEQGVVIRPWAERRVNSSMHDVQDQKGRARGSSTTEDTTYLGHVEIIHPSTREVLIEATGEAHLDPFAPALPDADFDPAPELTHLMEQLTDAAIKKLLSLSADRSPSLKVPTLSLALTPAATFRFSDARPPADLEMARMDSASLDLFELARARYLTPALTDAQAAALGRLPAGLYLRATPADDRLMLHEGDLLLTVDAEPALPQVLARLKFAAAPATVRVRQRSGAIVEVPFP